MQELSTGTAESQPKHIIQTNCTSDIDIYKENSDGSFPRLLTGASPNRISDNKDTTRNRNS